MQGPTPPTKPTPPTPPNMKTSSEAVPTATQAPTIKTTQPATSSTDTPKSSVVDKPQSTSTPPTESKSNIPPLGSYSNSSTNSKETTSQTAIAPAMPVQKNSPTSSGITIFLFIALLVTIGAAVIHWFKNNKPKQTSTINYSTESTDDIVNLILSQSPPDPAPQVTPKPLPKKLLLKPAEKPKNKGGFEVRI